MPVLLWISALSVTIIDELTSLVPIASTNMLPLPCAVIEPVTPPLFVGAVPSFSVILPFVVRNTMLPFAPFTAVVIMSLCFASVLIWVVASA